MGTPYSNQYIGGVAQTGTIATNGVLTIS